MDSCQLALIIILIVVIWLIYNDKKIGFANYIEEKQPHIIHKINIPSQW